MMTRRIAGVLSAAFVGMLALATPAAAINIVVNGGFETGDLTGWTSTAFDGWSTGVDNGFPHSGSFAAGSAAVGGESLISQTLPTVAGTLYDFSLWELDFGDGGASISVYWNGVPVNQQFGASPTYTQYFGNVLAVGNDVLSIGIRNDPGASWVDDIVVEAVDTPVPEPATGVLLLTGLAAAAARRRRLSKKA